MADAKISELAEVVGVSVDKLLSQIKEAGLSHTKADDSISNDDKSTLLQFLRRSHGDSGASDSAPKKITLKRKTVGTLKAASTHGRGKTVNVEVRKKRTYVKRSAVAEDAPEELEAEVEEIAVDSNVEATESAETAATTAATAATTATAAATTATATTATTETGDDGAFSLLNKNTCKSCKNIFPSNNLNNNTFKNTSLKYSTVN